ncbi:hypothetical protein PG995_011627 [Apiospora arundinis]
MSQHHATTPHQHQILMDPSHLGGLPGSRHMGHPGPSHYGAPGPATHGLPLYPSMTPTQPQSAGSKRSRPDDLDLTVSGLADLDQSDLDSMQQTPMGSAYTHAPPPPGAPPTHHHHRLPDQGPPTKMMRRDTGDGGLSSAAGGGAPSVVGQVGMPAPAPRPRGPKLKFTPEDDQLLIDLKENKNLTWKQIADFFPGRSSGTLQVRYCTKLKAKTTQWTDETDQKLRTALADYESEKWRIIANKVGTGFTPVACRERGGPAPGRRGERAGQRGHRGCRGRGLIAISVSAGGRFGSWVIRGQHYLSAAAPAAAAAATSATLAPPAPAPVSALAPGTGDSAAWT